MDPDIAAPRLISVCGDVPPWNVCVAEPYRGWIAELFHGLYKNRYYSADLSRFMGRPSCGWKQRGDLIFPHRRDRRRGPGGSAILVHHHCPHALDEIGMTHRGVGERELGGQALGQGPPSALAQQPQGPEQGGGGDGA